MINQNTQAASIGFTNFAQFLLGALNTSSSTFYNGAANRYYRVNQVGAYVQDNYKVRNDLTLNLGMRWDWEGPFSEKHGNLVNLDTAAYKYDPTTDTITNSGLVFAGNSRYATPGVSSSTLLNRQWGFGPRLGVVWAPGFAKNLTIRTGFGLYYDRGELFTYFSPGAGRGFSGPFGVTMQLPFTVPITPPTGATLSNPFGPAAPGSPGDPSVLAKQLPNQAAMINGAAPYIFGGYDAHNKLPYTENWSFDLQYQPFNSYLISLGYVGNHGANQVIPVPFNQPGIATASNPINGQTSSYGFNIVPAENIATYEGGNTDLRVPVPGLLEQLGALPDDRHVELQRAPGGTAQTLQPELSGHRIVHVVAFARRAIQPRVVLQRQQSPGTESVVCKLDLRPNPCLYCELLLPVASYSTGLELDFATRERVGSERCNFTAKRTAV